MVIAAAWRGIRYAAALVAGLWLVAAAGALELPAETWSGRSWFLNPFSWQLLFFLGFAFGRGWLVPPAYHPRLALTAAFVVVAAVPFSCHFGWECYAGYGTLPWLGDAHKALAPVIDKTHLGALRIVHFLALAYLAHAAAGPAGMRLSGSVVGLTCRVGRQTLAVFLSGLVLAQALGVVLDFLGRTALTVALANVGGCALLVLVAVLVEWFKGVHSARSRPVSAADALPDRPRPKDPLVRPDALAPLR
jgi:hypothetical protein